MRQEPVVAEPRFRVVLMVPSRVRLAPDAGLHLLAREGLEASITSMFAENEHGTLFSGPIRIVAESTAPAIDVAALRASRLAQAVVSFRALLGRAPVGDPSGVP
jgi:hypothetical protein